MFSHVTVGTNDYARSERFYDAVMAVLGVGVRHDEPQAG
jgi:catechol 2,3-dioxygenase-like lactoylglutathione lyase family enzyme